MKLALITTTVNVPTVLAQYRRLGRDVMFFIAGDYKTPVVEVSDFLYDIPNHFYFGPAFQNRWKCSELLGWNTDSRRNIALLEALKWGAEVIVSVDDDMIPLSPDFFYHLERVFSEPFSGLRLGSSGYWFDAGQYTVPTARQRGLPAEFVTKSDPSFISDVQIGALQGSILGVPDTDAMTAIVNRPVITGISDTLRAGFVVDLAAKAVFNSQLTAFRREFAPAFFQFYKEQGRNTDIIASITMRRIMWQQGYYTYYGPPVGYHARQKRPLLNDLKAEMWGLEHIEAFQDFIDTLEMKGSVVGQLRTMYMMLPDKLCSPTMRACALAFLDDCVGVL